MIIKMINLNKIILKKLISNTKKNVINMKYKIHWQR